MPRRDLDLYETPVHYVEPLLALIGSLHGLRVYEPCVGRGHISRHLTAARELRTNDLDHTCVATTHLDARDPDAWQWVPEPLDWTITNPPFSDALPILQHAIQMSRNVAFLARLSFLEPTRTRARFWTLFPPTDVIVLPRYSFRLDDQGRRQTDTVTCCWLLWREARPPCLYFSVPRDPFTLTSPTR